MSRRKKTRQQKIIADLRRQIATSKPKNTIESTQIEPKVYTFSNEFTNTIQGSVKTISPYEHTFLQKDLKKPMIITTSIIALEFLLLFLLRKHIVLLPFSY